MPGRLLLVMLFSLPLAGGCAGLREPGAASDGWLARTRRQFGRVARDIEADLNFHENEGLEAFDSKAVQQVNAMRGEMNGAAAVSRPSHAGSENVVQEKTTFRAE